MRLIYNDPNRHFGGALDDAGIRLQHYLDVLHNEVKRLSENPLATEDVQDAYSFCLACQ